MATIALTRPVHTHRASSGLPPLSTDISLDADTMNGQPPQSQPPPKPNRHIPVCPPGPPPAVAPASPLQPKPGGENNGCLQKSLLFPPDRYRRLHKGDLYLFIIDAAGVAAALDHIARQPLPDPSLVFPWLHGLHPGNHAQRAFFSQRRRLPRETPCCLRGLTLVKDDGQLHKSRLKGAIAADEFMQPNSIAEFVDADPKEGFSVRNFQIQTAKIAMTSDIIVYGDEGDSHGRDSLEKLGWDIAAAQKRWKEKHDFEGHPLPLYNTFICIDNFATFERSYPDIVAVDSDGCLTGNVIDFFHQERKEMYAMTRASEISLNVWLGPTPEPQSDDEEPFDILIECSDLGHLSPRSLRALIEVEISPGQKAYVDFPSSGTIPPPTWPQAEAYTILEFCKWIYHLAHGTTPPSVPQSNLVHAGDGEQSEANRADISPAVECAPCGARPYKVLIHCADGYTESTMLAIAYLSYSTGWPIPEAWLKLHTELRRNFFAYPTDVAVLTALAPRLVSESPVCSDKNMGAITSMLQNEPAWFSSLDGSFPSRILDYMYLGNLNHANNPQLLKVLGITQILSVGEMAMWDSEELEKWGEENVCVIQGVQDNGIDPLTEEFERCLKFIERGHRRGTATLVHCRVGVSRSATICIAEVMRCMNLSLPRAYCFVRARRLNVIIQPHLRFAYELLKWEEELRKSQAGDRGITSCAKRELEWGEIAREVALMNQPYVRTLAFASIH